MIDRIRLALFIVAVAAAYLSIVFAAGEWISNIPADIHPLALAVTAIVSVLVATFLPRVGKAS